MRNVDFTFLGINLDRGSTWENHINKVYSKIAYFWIRSTLFFLLSKILFMVYYGLIFPRLSCGIMLWSNLLCSQTFRSHLDMPYKAIRILGQLNYRDSSCENFKNIRIWLLQVSTFLRRYYIVV